MSGADARPPDAPHPARPDSHHNRFPVVGIGASAGGINALKQFFAAMPADSGMAFVVILHLSQHHESSLAEILQSQTAMSVRQVTETIKVEPDHVYVIPPAKHLELVDSLIRLKEPDRIKGDRVPIDLFFRSLANAYGKDAISVILSGTGSDGTFGLKRIKEFGGLTFAQSPEDAEYDGMPLSAINTGLVDVILPVAEIPEKLIRLSRLAEQMVIHEEERVEEVKPPGKVKTDALRELLTLIHVRTGHDFTNYKRPTLLRRIARRLQVKELGDIPAYLDLLRDDPGEAQQLLRDLLITVTNFFRDKEAFAALEQDVVPKLFTGKTSADVIRAWVVGCATGEEAYSLAMLLCEYASKLPDPPRIQIFASDINEEAIRAARDCCYDESIVADVSPERLRQFFIKEGHVYRVKKELREMVLFAPHNVLRDPPFSRLDLITCRNLLIYLTRETQEKVLGIFNFALRYDGFLFLGSSESAESQPALFSAVNRKQRIYRSRPALRHRLLPEMPIEGRSVIRIPEAPSPAESAGTFAAIHLRLVEQYAPPSVLVNEDYDILHSSENAGRFLRFVGGEPSHNLLKAVHPALQLDLRSVLLSAKQEGQPQRATHIRARIDGAERLVNLVVRPSGTVFLVIFEEQQESPADQEADSIAGVMAGDEAIASVVRRLEAELLMAQDRLRSTLEQSETSTEELKASNEELQAINEELRSASEELETSKEEMQSLNEELATVNQELKAKVDEIVRANSDLQNLMQSTDIGTIFLDRALHIKRFTPRVKELFNLIPTDVGRPLGHITHNLDYNLLADEAAEVLETLRIKEREVRGGTGDSRYLVRLAPYRTVDDRIDGVVLSFQDITDLKRAADQIQESEERFRAIIGQATAGIAQTDLTGRFNLVNDRYCELVGYPREELLQIRMQEITHEEDLPCNLDLFERMLRTGEPFTIEKRYRRKNGSLVWVSNSVSIVRDADGNPKYMLAFSLDISDRKLAEQALQRSEERFSNLLDNLPAAAYTCDAEGLITYYNRRAVDLWGRAPNLNDPAEKFCGSFKLYRTDGTPIPHDQCWMALAIRERKAFDGNEIVIERPDGSRFIALAHSNPIYNETGAMIGAINVLVDITERKNMEKALRESEERFRTLSEAAPALIWFDDAEGNCLYVNQQYLDFSGQTLEEIIGTGWHLALHPEDGEAYVNDFLAAQREQRPFHHRTRIRRRDGEWRWIESFAQPLFGADGAYLGHVGVSPDITESKRAEEALQEADQRKDEFLATLAHELRNPLAAIRPALEVMRRRDEQQGEAARLVIERQLGQIVRLVDDLLDISRITHGKISLKIERVALSAIVDSALETIRSLDAIDERELIVSLPAEQLYLDADPTRLTQILLNLLTNAARYTGSDGKIRLAAGREGDQVIVRIADTGIGISQEVLPNVFDLFAQGMQAGTGTTGGLGIGLSLVKRLTELHGGTVEALSAGVGEGSEFVVRLPLAAEQRPASRPPSAASDFAGSSSPTRRVLVVDDNTDSAQMLKVLLTMDGHDVRLAYDGKTGVKTALEFKPELIILDLGLPDIDGYEVAERIRSQLPQTLLVALTGWGGASHRRRTQEAGFDRHLVKPLNFDDLPELLSAAGRNQPTRRPS